MAKYGKAAEIAARLLTDQREVEPKSAWSRGVAEVYPDNASSREKNCPKVSFLALCGAGAIRGVPRGTYTRSPKNGGYVMRALGAVQSNPDLLLNPQSLWRIATNNLAVSQNGQIEVLAALWDAGFIEDPQK